MGHRQQRRYPDRRACPPKPADGFNFDRAQTLASIQRIKQIRKNLEATVIIQHDPRDIGKLPAFPAFAK